ncbi:MAG: ABC transporter ATP-binding protein/permease [Formosimonas sp.]
MNMSSQRPSPDENEWLRDTKPNLKNDEKALNNDGLAGYKDIFRMGVRYWFSKDAAWAWGLSIVLLILSTGVVQLNVRFASWYKEFYDALEQKNLPGFWAGIVLFAQLATAWVLVNTYKTYLTNSLQLRWRTWLTEQYSKLYLRNHRYYYLEHLRHQDNPDQRITEDLDTFSSLALDLFFGLFISIFSIYEFSKLMFEISGDIDITVFGQALHIPDYMFYGAVVYILIGSLVTHFIGRRLIKLNILSERYNANFRYHIIRAREYAEGISFLNGGLHHMTEARRRFSILRSNWGTYIFQLKLVNFSAFSFGQAAVIFPFIVAAPRYFSNQITLGTLMQIGNTFNHLSDALSWFIDNYTTLARFRAASTRILNLEKSLNFVDEQNKKNQITNTPNNTGGVVLSHVYLNRPQFDEHNQIHETPQVLGLDWQITPGQRWLITGASGSGKSTILRAIAALWPYGRGHIDVPQKSKIQFLPQRPYFPVATLRDALAYPAAADAYTDAAYETVLEMSQLKHLQTRLSETNNWLQVLSGGEQQRLAFARVFLQRPDYLFLDEATASLDLDNEHALYTTLVSFLPNLTLVSVSHHEQLKEFHNHALHLTPDELGGFKAKTQTL